MSDPMITTAAEAIEDVMVRHLGRDLGTIHRDAIVSAGVAAALRVMADEIEASTTFLTVDLAPLVVAKHVRERAEGLDRGAP